MKYLIVVGVLVLLISGCGNSALLISKCEEYETTVKKGILQTTQMNEDYGYNYSSENSIKNYNRLCGDVTGLINEKGVE